MINAGIIKSIPVAGQLFQYFIFHNYPVKLLSLLREKRIPFFPFILGQNRFVIMNQNSLKVCLRNDFKIDNDPLSHSELYDARLDDEILTLLEEEERNRKMKKAKKVNEK